MIHGHTMYLNEYFGIKKMHLINSTMIAIDIWKLIYNAPNKNDTKKHQMKNSKYNLLILCRIQFYDIIFFLP